MAANLRIPKSQQVIEDNGYTRMFVAAYSKLVMLTTPAFTPHIKTNAIPEKRAIRALVQGYLILLNFPKFCDRGDTF